MLLFFFSPPGIGGMVYMNENGDRDTDFTLIDVDPNKGDWRVGTDSCRYIAPKVFSFRLTLQTFELFMIFMTSYMILPSLCRMS